MKTAVYAVLLFLLQLPLGAATLPEAVTFRADGSFRIGDTEFLFQQFTADWSPADNRSWRNRKGSARPDGVELTAKLPPQFASGSVAESIRPAGPRSFDVKLKVKFPAAVSLGSLHGVITLPRQPRTVLIDGKPERLLPSPGKIVLLRRKASSLRIPVANGYRVTVTGSPLNLLIQDNRKFGTESLSIRLKATPDAGAMTESALNLQFSVEPLPAQPVSLAGAANAGFRDETAGDGKGGWTDQGPECDLRMLQQGELRFGGFTFTIPAPAAATGYNAVILSGKERNFTAQTVTLPLPENRAGAVNLLHASAWTPPQGRTLGILCAEYPDGAIERIPVRARLDCGNWRNPSDARNATVAWHTEEQTHSAGLYVSSFPLKRKGPKQLRFEIASPQAIWMIAGVLLSPEATPLAPLDNQPLVIRENAEWKPLLFQRKNPRNTPLDFSFLLDAPAGKYGFIQPSPAGHLTFERAPEKRIRLYGPNLCFTANFLSKKEADRLADHLASCGYNTVRIHHHDTLLTDPAAPDSVTLNPEELDRLDYLLFRMKERGIYVTTDLYTNRKFKPGDHIPEFIEKEQPQMKILLPVSKAAMENWKSFARKWMRHKNPYTGNTWAEEPALYCINLVNEEPLTLYWNRSKAAAALYRKKFQEYCAKHNLPPSKAAHNNPVFRLFLHELQEAALVEQIRFVKEELGVKALVTSLNCGREIPLALLRDHFDVVDNHAYFDHPGFPKNRWNLPFSYLQRSAISEMASVPRDLMPTRLPGKPFLVTEFNYCNPNLYRAEAGPLIGGYAALQNWDALYRFAWSHSARDIEQVVSAYGFNAVNDPLAQFSDRIAIAMFLRGDVKPAEILCSYQVPRNSFERKLITGFPPAFKNLGLITAVGSQPEDRRSGTPSLLPILPADATRPDRLKDRKIAALWEQANRRRLAVSATGELRLDAEKNTFTVTSPRTESVTLSSGDLAAGQLRVRQADGFQTIAAISLDGKALSESSSVLFFQLTDVASSGLKFSNRSKRLVLYRGNLPLLVRKGTATVEFVSDRPCTVTALHCDGTPCGSVRGSFQDGIYRFQADTHQFPGGVMAYHLTR